MTLKPWIGLVTGKAETGLNAVSGNPEGDDLFIVHGYTTSTDDVLRRHRLLRAALEANGYQGAVVSFDWPSGTQAAACLIDREKADRSACKLVSGGIAPFVTFDDPANCDVSVHVPTHSMGTYVVRQAFDRADDAAGPSAENWSVAQLMFCAGDMSPDVMGPSDAGKSVYPHAVRFTCLYDRHDAVLSVSGAKCAGISPRAGQIGLPANAASRSVDVDCSALCDRRRNTYPGGINQDHSLYFVDATFLHDLHETIKGDRDRMAFDTRELRGGRLHLRVPGQPLPGRFCAS